MITPIKHPVLIIITQVPHLKIEKFWRRKKRTQKYTQLWENEFSWLRKDSESDTNAKSIICGEVFSLFHQLELYTYVRVFDFSSVCYLLTKMFCVCVCFSEGACIIYLKSFQIYHFIIPACLHYFLSFCFLIFESIIKKNTTYELKLYIECLTIETIDKQYSNIPISYHTTQAVQPGSQTVKFCWTSFFRKNF